MLLDVQPEGATHEADDCPYCTPEQQENTVPETLTDAEVQAKVDAAVAEATAPLVEKIAELETAETVTAEKAQVAELQSELDKALAAKKVAEDTLTASLDYLKSVEAAEVETAAREELKAQRVAELDGLLTEERIAERADAYTDMTEEAFTAALADMKAINPAVGAPTTIPTKTALTAVEVVNPTKSAGRAVIVDLYTAGVNVGAIA